MAKIKINNKNHNMKFSLAFWETMKTEYDLTQSNFDEKLEKEFGKFAALVVYFGIYYGLPASNRPESVEKMSVSLDDIKDELDMSVLDVIEETYIEGMTKAQKDLVEKAKKLKEQELDRLTGQAISKKK